MTVLAVGRDDRVIWPERLHRADCDRLLADVQVHETADLRRAVELDALLLKAANQEHLPKQVESVLAIDGRLGPHGSGSSVEMSPSGKATSRALSQRGTILPLRFPG